MRKSGETGTFVQHTSGFAMQATGFRKINILAGWITGAIAAIVYLLTMEPTASFWDCSEFIATGYKLEVGHSPGAPFFMLIQRIAALMAGGNVKNVAACINAWSAVASGLTIVLLFWTITAFGKRLLLRSAINDTGAGRPAAEPDKRQAVVLLSAGFAGALAYACSDTFWFSAVEAEVYATSSLLTALCFWAMLQWDACATKPNADRWLAFIALLIGMSTGVHLLCLLTIPAMAMMYYFRRYDVTLKGGIVAFGVGCAALGFVQYGLIQGIPMAAGALDLLFVNSFGLPFDSGAIGMMVIIAAIITLLLNRARKKGWHLAHTAVCCVAFMLIGLLSYLAPILRSRADVPVDMTNPDNARALVSYLRRDMFGSQHLFYGRDYDAVVTGVTWGEALYVRGRKGGKDVYEIAGRTQKPLFGNDAERIFPRLWSTSPEYARFYTHYLGLEAGERPDAGDNLKFFFGYQVNWMWWRYFMWNFAGRQNGFTGGGDPKNGNWTSGMPGVDRVLSFGTHQIGDPDAMADGFRNNAARNELYYIPLLFGLAGLIYQCRRRSRDALVLGILFFFTSIAVVIYVNMSPLQDSERDYAFSGSFYTFAIWMGVGVIALDRLLLRLRKTGWNPYFTLLLCLPLPMLMATKEWHDHDRHRKTLARATACNTLMSCAPDAVLFTDGDNATYPLWYLQEVEGVRRDVRVVCFPLLLQGWYIDQLSNRINDAAPVPIVWSRNEYLGEGPDNLSYVDHAALPDVPALPPGYFMPIRDFCRFVVSDKKIQDRGMQVNYIPARQIKIPMLAKSDLHTLSGGMDSNTISTDMRISFGADKSIFAKNELAELAIIAAIAGEGWKRPVYFTDLGQTRELGNLNDFMRLEGTVYRLLPFRKTDSAAAAAHAGSIDGTKSYELFTKVYRWGGAERPDVYFDGTNRDMLVSYRMAAARIAGELTAQHRNADALRLLDAVSKGITEQAYPYDVTGAFLAGAYYGAGGMQQAGALARKVVDHAAADMQYLGTLDNPDDTWLAHEVQQDVGMMKTVAEAAIRAGDAPVAAYALRGIEGTKGTGVVPPERITQLMESLQVMQRGQIPAGRP